MAVPSAATYMLRTYAGERGWIPALKQPVSLNMALRLFAEGATQKHPEFFRITDASTGEVYRVRYDRLTEYRALAAESKQDASEGGGARA